MKRTFLLVCVSLLAMEVSRAQKAPIKLETPDVRPVVLSVNDPKYTQDARDHHIAGTVNVWGRVGLDGLVMKALIIHGLGYGLDEAALAAVRKDRFKPAMKNGKPIICDVYWEFKFPQ